MGNIAQILANRGAYQRLLLQDRLRRQQEAEDLARAKAESERVSEPVIESQMGQLPGTPGRPAYPEIGTPAIPGSTPSGIPLRMTMPTARAPNDKETEQRLLEAALRLGDPAVAAQLFASTANQRNRTSSAEGIEADRLAELQRQWVAEGGGAGARPLDTVNLGNARQIRRGNRNQATGYGHDAARKGVEFRAVADSDRLMRSEYGAPAEFFKGVQDVAQASTRGAEADAAPDYYQNRADAWGAQANLRDAKRETEEQLRDPRVALMYERITGEGIDNDISWEELAQLRETGPQKLRIVTADADRAEERSRKAGIEADVAGQTAGFRIDTAGNKERRTRAEADLAERTVDSKADKAQWDARLARVRADVAADLGDANVRSARANAMVDEETVDSRISRAGSLAEQAQLKQAEMEAKAELDKKYGAQEREKGLRLIEEQIGRTLTAREREEWDLRMAKSYENETRRLMQEKLESQIRKNDRTATPTASGKIPEDMKIMLQAYWKAGDEGERQEILAAAHKRYGPRGYIREIKPTGWFAGVRSPEYELTPKAMTLAPRGGGSVTPGLEGDDDLDLGGMM